ncbi:MAG: hypothetical protein ABWY13_20010 [Mesorhizobium sp.]|jgi:hypothetical protein
MRHVLPPLHEGHAPTFLHYAFQDALDAYEDWQVGAPEPDVECDGKLTPISAVFGRMRGCTDILPIRVFDDVQAVVDEPSLAQFSGNQVTYAEAARVLRALCVERLKS